MKKTFLIFLLLPCAVAGVQFISCRKPVPPDPCAGLKPVSADFNFYQKLDNIDSLFKVDTVYRSSWTSVIFSATEKNATYKWEIEDSREPPPVTQSFFLFFKEPYGKIAVQLSVKKEPDKLCFPADDGVDTVTKNLYVVDPNKIPPAFLGTFTGYYTDNPNDVFDITIVDFGPAPEEHGWHLTGYGIRVFDLQKGCRNVKIEPNEGVPSIDFQSYRNFKITVKVYSNAPCGVIDPIVATGRVYDQNNKISIFVASYHVNTKTNTSARTDYQFIGTRKK